MSATFLPELAVVVPSYNESEVFSTSLETLLSVLHSLREKKKISPSSHLVFVDDGSRDPTWALIESASKQYSQVRGIKLSANRGHQIALLAGLSASAKADATISIDADLQDDPNAIALMVDKFLQGAEVVYGVRNDRSSDSFFKRSTAKLFYRCMGKMGVKQIENHADFRLLSRRALNSLLEYKETNLYLRGLIPLLGYRSEQVLYARNPRLAGESKYPFGKMLNLAVDGVTSFSLSPLRFVSVLGFLISAFSLGVILYALVRYFDGHTVSGWTSVILAIFFIGGVQTLCLGILGEYIGRIYVESKQRPKFFIESTLGFEESKDEN